MCEEGKVFKRYQGSDRLFVEYKGKERVQKGVSCFVLDNWFFLGQWFCGDISFGGEMMSLVFYFSIGV